MEAIPEPLLYVSGYLKKHQSAYYDRLSAIRHDDDWEGWVSFFLEGVEAAADEAQGSIVAIAARIAEDRKRVLELGTSTLATLRLFEHLPTMPRDAMGSDAQHIALEDDTRAIGAHTQMRLDAVRRALAKIEDGSYGRSDESGEPISRERLEARARTRAAGGGGRIRRQVAGRHPRAVFGARARRSDGSSSNRAWHRTRSRPSAAAPAPVPSATSG